MLAVILHQILLARESSRLDLLFGNPYERLDRIVFRGERIKFWEATAQAWPNRDFAVARLRLRLVAMLLLG